MARILITGMSGAGKSSLLAELTARGRLTVDTDYDDWVLASGLWHEPRMEELLRRNSEIIVSGTVENQGRFSDWFDHVVLLSAPVEVLIERVRHRMNNPYGSTAEQRAEIRRNVSEVEPLLRRTATVELDGQSALPELADSIEQLL